MAHPALLPDSGDDCRSARRARALGEHQHISPADLASGQPPAGCGSITSGDLPETPPTVAVMNVAPTAWDVARPVFGSIDATLGLALDHVTLSPVTTLPPASLTTAVNWTTEPRVAWGSLPGRTVTEPTCITWNVAVADALPDLAMIPAVPAATPVATALALTVATDASVLDQENVADGMT